MVHGQGRRRANLGMELWMGMGNVLRGGGEADSCKGVVRDE